MFSWRSVFGRQTVDESAAGGGDQESEADEKQMSPEDRVARLERENRWTKGIAVALEAVNRRANRGAEDR